MMDWLLDTLVWTAALIALVLLIRRPVAQLFGPRLAYALWALPTLRLILPPITLPAWMAPDEPQVIMPIADNAGLAIAEPIVAPITQMEPAFDWASLIPLMLALWLVGAATFLFQRFRNYHRMRRDLLDQAREVGREGTIRLIESPATNAPIALGVWDRIVALPPGFMAQENVHARNLALRHEIAHHHGRDLLVNMLVQPLFALHWFNPLGALGWLALRRDQEAACDARVMAQSEAENRPEDRAAYANIIANFAAGPNVALAAPMACPVLGDKSIIHRLRSLNMKDQSRARRIAGRGLLAAAVIALPLTASVSYAEGTGPDVPSAPIAPIAPSAPAAPAAPPAPLAPPAPPAPIIQFQSAASADDGEHRVERHVVVTKEIEKDGSGKKVRMVKIHEGDELSEEELEKIMAEVKKGLAEADIAIEEAHKIAIEMADGAGKDHVIVKMSCDGDGPVSETTTKAGKKVMKICKTQIMASALEGLRNARRDIAADKEMSKDIRERVLQELDAKIAEWEKRGS